jgi:competence protein ComEC
MTAVVLIAVIVDRRAVTFRTLAVAAMIVLALAPEALVHPSFQMSFAATLGLVALVQFGMPRLLASPDSSTAMRIALWGGREMMMLMLASLFAGLATTPYAAFHFHRVTPFGLLANLVAMPFGLDGVFWWLMGIGIDWMIAVTRWVAALPGAVGRMAAFGTGPLIAASIGIILMGLLRTPLRWSGALLLGLAVVWALAVPEPDVLISGDVGQWDSKAVGFGDSSVSPTDSVSQQNRETARSSTISIRSRRWLAVSRSGPQSSRTNKSALTRLRNRRVKRPSPWAWPGF